MLKDTINADLKTAMLSGDKTRVEVLKMLKSALLYKEVELGVRDSGLTEDQAIEVLIKEAKKRQDAAEMYQKAGNNVKAEAELSEQAVTRQYLPAQMSDEDLTTIVDQVLASSGEVSMKDMGRIIGAVKVTVGNTADGSRISMIVKQKLV